MEFITIDRAWTQITTKVSVSQSYQAYTPKDTTYDASKHGGNRAIHNWAHPNTETTSSNGSSNGPIPWFKLVLQRFYPVHSRRNRLNWQIDSNGDGGLVDLNCELKSIGLSGTR